MPDRKNKKAVILLGAEVEPTTELKSLCEGGYVIAADSGIRHAAVLGLEVDLWVGDFDSVSPEDEAEHAKVPRQTFSPDKDKTDGELAIDAALGRKISQFVLVGSLGGMRTDHALLNAFQAVELARTGKDVIMSSGRETAVPLLAGTREFNLALGTRFSLIGFSSLEGVSIEGAKWPLTDRTVPAGSSITLSNVALGTVTITLRNGRALFISGSGG